MVLVQLFPRVGRAEGGAKVAHASPECTPHLGKPLRPQYEQRHHEHEDEVRGLKDVADHSTKLTGRSGTVGGIPQPPTITPARRLSDAEYG